MNVSAPAASAQDSANGTGQTPSTWSNPASEPQSNVQFMNSAPGAEGNFARDPDQNRPIQYGSGDGNLQAGANNNQPQYSVAPGPGLSFSGSPRSNSSVFGNNSEYNGQSPYWYYRTGQPSRGYSQPRYSPYIPYPNNNNGSQYGGGFQQQPQYATAPAGLTIPATLSTSISTQAAQAGDYVQAAMNYSVHLQGYTYIPGGSTLSGEITQAKAGRYFGRSGALSIEFNRLTLPNGQSVPIQAHLVGHIGKYNDKDGVYHGEGWGTKVGSFLTRTAIGAGGGALFGTAIGAIGGGGGYLGTGAWSGAAIGGGIGILDDLMARRGRNVIIHSGTSLQVQLDEPVQIPMTDMITGRS
jgi:hypothetical protein